MSRPEIGLCDYDVSAVARPYFMDLLSNGREIARSASNVVDWDSGVFTVILPAGLESPISAEQLRFGGVWSARDRHSRWSSDDEAVSPVARLSRAVVGGLQRGGDLGLTENTLDRESDLNGLVLGDSARQEQYFVVSPGMSVSQVREVLEEADNAWMMLGFVSNVPCEAARWLTAPDLSSFTKGIHLAFCTAMDGETYMVWRRKSETELSDRPVTT